MTVLALLYKELQHHAGAVAALTATWAAAWVISLSFNMSNESDTLLTAGTNLVYYAIPMVTAFLVRRLVVLEYTQDTQSFLAALPLSAVLHTGLKYALGLLGSLTLALGTVLFTALIVSRQEIITASFLLTTLLQSTAVVFAWYGLSFCAAHLGRYRTTYWLLLLALSFTLEELDPEVWKHTLWTSGLGESLDEIRGSVPVMPLLVSLAWGLVTSAIGLGLGMWRQGSQVASWYTPMATAERTLLVLVVVFGMLASEVVEHAYHPGGPAYTALPQVSEGAAVVRVSSRHLTQVGHDLGQALDGLGEALDDRDWPEVALVPVLDDANTAAAIRASEHGELILELDETQSATALVRHCLQLALVDRTAGLPLLRADQAWILDGAAMWWLASDRPTTLELRAGYAATAGLTVRDLETGERLRLMLGPDVAQAVGWAGLETIEAHGGREAVLAVLTEVIRPHRADFAGALATSARDPYPVISDTTGLDRDHFLEAWLETLEGHASAHSERIAAFTPDWGALSMAQEGSVDVMLRSRWSGPPPPGLRLMWMTVDPLHVAPISVLSDDVLPLTSASVDTPMTVDRRRDLAATYRLHVDDIDGELWSGLEVYR